MDRDKLIVAGYVLVILIGFVGVAVLAYPKGHEVRGWELEKIDGRIADLESRVATLEGGKR